VKLYSRPGNDLTWRFPLIVEATVRLRLQSCVIDGEAVACGKDGLSSSMPSAALRSFSRNADRDGQHLSIRQCCLRFHHNESKQGNT